MTVIAMRIIPPVGKTPYEYSADKPGESRLGVFWYKVNGYIVPIDWAERVLPHCAFFLGEDLLWHTVWVTTNRMDDEYFTAMPWPKFADAAMHGRVVESSKFGMSYSEMLDMVRRVFNREAARLICNIHPAKLYAEFGSKVEVYIPRNIFFDMHEEGFEQMMITL